MTWKRTESVWADCWEADIGTAGKLSVWRYRKTDQFWDVSVFGCARSRCMSEKAAKASAIRLARKYMAEAEAKLKELEAGGE